MSISIVYKVNESGFVPCDHLLVGWPTESIPSSGFVGMVTLRNKNKEESYDIYLEKTTDEESLSLEEVFKLDIYAEEKLLMLCIERGMTNFSLYIEGEETMSSATLNEEPLELFDRIDEDGNLLNVVEERNVSHRAGYWHRVAHMWIIKKTKDGTQILVQKRSQNKDSYPGFYDISSAGHVQAGQDVISSAMRELNEELGVVVDRTQLKELGTYKVKHDDEFYGQPFVDRELATVFLVTKEVEIGDLKLQKSEIESVEWMEIDSCCEDVMDTEDKYCIDPTEFEFLYEYLEGEDGK